MKVEIDKAQLYEAQLALLGIKNGYPKAMNRALNNTLVPARKAAVEKISAKITPRVGIIKEAFSEKRSNWKILSASIFVEKNKKVPLIYYAAAKRKSGVGIRVYKSKGRYLIKHAFIATMPKTSETQKKQHAGVFWRKTDLVGTGKSKHEMPMLAVLGKKSKIRLPIEERWGPSIQQVFDDKDIIDPSSKKGLEILMKKFSHEVDYLLSQVK